MTLLSRPIGPMAVVARSIPLRAIAVIGLVLLAYNYSLLTLARGLTLQTPLAYLALVPIIAIVLAVARLRIEPPTLPINDRQVDWIVGLGLLAAASAVLILVPQPTSSTFWLERIDLLTLPLFVSGLIALVFGVRKVWSLKGPIAFLLLAWPVPFQLLLSTTSDQFTDITASAVAAVVHVLPLATPSPSDHTLLIIGQGRGAFGVSITSACAGMNSFVGFLLLGTAFLYVVRGPILRRALWLAIGLAIVFALNIIRILAILATGATLGAEAALDVLHPVGGLIVFNVGVLAMVALVPRFGLRFVNLTDRKAAAGPPPATTTSAPASTDTAAPVIEAAPIARVRPAFVVALAVAAALAVTNAAYARFEAISSGVADARLTSFDIRTAKVSGWQTHFVENIVVGKPYFGADSTWQRIVYQPTAAATFRSSIISYVDVLTTGDPGTFAAYGIQACYQFHGFDIASISTVDVGAGVDGQVIDYTDRKTKASWSALWWEWPYRAGDKTRYERIVVFMLGGPGATYTGVTPQQVGTQDPRFVDTDSFLVTLGRSIVQSQLRTASR